MNKNGIGLGLVISQQIVQQYDGEISFVSAPEKGSVFTFTFKLQQSQEDIRGVPGAKQVDVKNYFPD